jgi:hypothetical protein
MPNANAPITAPALKLLRALAELLALPSATNREYMTITLARIAAPIHAFRMCF